MQTRATINLSGGEGGMDSGRPGPRPAGAVAKPPASSAAAALSNLKVRTPTPTIYIQIQFSREISTNCANILAERVGFEPTNTVRCYTLSRRAPSTARPPLLAAARVPERAQAIKFTRWRPCSAEPACSAAEHRSKGRAGPAAAV